MHLVRWLQNAWFSLSLQFLILPLPTWANRYISCEDIGYDDCGSGDLGLLGSLLLIGLLILFLVAFFRSKQLRKFAFLYGVVLLAAGLGAYWIKGVSGKEWLFICALAIGILYWKFEHKLLNTKILNDDKQPPK